jgi:hypothetical protein
MISEFRFSISDCFISEFGFSRSLTKSEVQVLSFGEDLGEARW